MNKPFQIEESLIYTGPTLGTTSTIQSAWTLETPEEIVAGINRAMAEFGIPPVTKQSPSVVDFWRHVYEDQLGALIKRPMDSCLLTVDVAATRKRCLSCGAMTNPAGELPCNH